MCHSVLLCSHRQGYVKEVLRVSYIIGVKKLAEELGISRETLYRYMKKGLPYHTISTKKRAFIIEEVKAWLEGRE